MSDIIAVGKLRAFERVERIEADITELNADKSEVYKEIRGEGYDVKTVRKIIAKRKLADDVRDEQDTLFELYWDALNGSSRVHVYEATPLAGNPNTGPSSQAAREAEEVAASSRVAQGRGDGRSVPVPVSNPAPATNSNTSTPFLPGRLDVETGAVVAPLAAAPVTPFEPPAFLVKAKEA